MTDKTGYTKMPLGLSRGEGLRKSEPYKIRLSGISIPTESILGRLAKKGKGKKTSGALAPTEVTKVFESEEVETLLTGLLKAFEDSATTHYNVKRAKTSITTVKGGGGKIELGLGVSVFKVFDIEGNLKGEVTQGIEIEIERKA